MNRHPWRSGTTTRCWASTATPTKRHQEGLPQAGDEAPSGPQSGRPEGRRAVQGGQGSVRGALTDADKRAAYDRYGHAGVDPQRGHGGRRRGLRRASPTPSATSSATSSVRRPRRPRPSVYRGADLRYNLEITLEQAARGTETQIRIPTYEDCETCKGTGAKPGTQPADLPHLRRPGHRCACSRASSPSSRPARRATAPARSSRTPARPATARDGSRSRRRSSVKIPAGRGRRRSHPPLGRRASRASTAARPATSTSQIQLKPHAVFQRDGDDLHCEMPVSFTHGGARRRDRDSDARRLGEDQDSRRDAVAARSSACAARASRACAADDPGDLLCHVVVETPVQPHRAPEGAAARARGRSTSRTATATTRAPSRWMEKVREFFAG